MKSGSGGQILGRKYFPHGNRLKALVGNELSESTHTFAERLEEKATPVCRRFAVPCVARLVRRLRNPRYALKHNQRLGWRRLSA